MANFIQTDMGFLLKSKSPLDIKQNFTTLEEMRNFNIKHLSNTAMATCDEDGKLYVYNVNNTENATTGKWKVIESSSMTQGVEIYENYSQFPTIIENCIVYSKEDYEDIENSKTYSKGFYYGNLDTLSYSFIGYNPTVATEETIGLIKPDGITTVVSDEGILSAVATDVAITEDINIYGIAEGFGYTNGDTISNGTKITDVLKSLLQKIIHPTYTNPTLSISVSNTVLEYGTENLITITPTFTQNHAGDIQTFQIYRDGSVIYEDTDITSYTDIYTPSSIDSFKYSCIVTYSDGEILQNNIGEDDENGRILASSISKESSAIVPVYPSYVGVCDDTDTIDETLISSLAKKVELKGTKNISFTTSKSCMVFAYPQTYGTISSIIDKNGFDVTASFANHTITINSVDYYVYKSESCSGNYVMKFSY